MGKRQICLDGIQKRERDESKKLHRQRILIPLQDRCLASRDAGNDPVRSESLKGEDRSFVI